MLNPMQKFHAVVMQSLVHLMQTNAMPRNMVILTKLQVISRLSLMQN